MEGNAAETGQEEGRIEVVLQEAVDNVAVAVAVAPREERMVVVGRIGLQVEARSIAVGLGVAGLL